jgi:cysteinyl-tRNA synthetase
LDQVFLKLDLFEKVEEEKVEIPSEVRDLAEQRLQAKAEKNYALADELRNKITEM